MSGIVLVFLIIGILLLIRYYPSQQNFVKTNLNLNIPVGGEFTSNVRLTNYKDSAQTFKISITDMDGMASLSEKEFTLEPGEKKEIMIFVKDSQGKAGIYAGQLVIEAGNTVEKKTIVVGVQDSNYAFAIVHNKILKYDNVYPGGKFGIDVKVHDLGNIASPTVMTKYYVENFEGDTFFSEEEQFSVDGSKTILIDIPKSWDKGDYLFVTEIDYKGTVSLASSIFTVEDRAKGWLSGNIKFFVAIVLIFVFGILVLFIYFVKTRDDLLLQLKKQQSAELSRNLKYISTSKKAISKSKEHPAKKKKKILQLEQAKKRIVGKIKTKQKEQRKKIKQFKSKKQKPKAKSQLVKWKEQGYKMYDAENEVKKITKKRIKQHVKDLSKQGYDTSFLKK